MSSVENNRPESIEPQIREERERKEQMRERKKNPCDFLEKDSKQKEMNRSHNVQHFHTSTV